MEGLGDQSEVVQLTGKTSKVEFFVVRLRVKLSGQKICSKSVTIVIGSISGRF